jgi:hypothetical protein
MIGDFADCVPSDMRRRIKHSPPSASSCQKCRDSSSRRFHPCFCGAPETNRHVLGAMPWTRPSSSGSRRSHTAPMQQRIDFIERGGPDWILQRTRGPVPVSERAICTRPGMCFITRGSTSEVTMTPRRQNYSCLSCWSMSEADGHQDEGTWTRMSSAASARRNHALALNHSRIFVATTPRVARTVQHSQST